MLVGSYEHSGDRVAIVEFASVVLEYGVDHTDLAWQLDWHFGALPVTAAPPELRVWVGDMGAYDPLPAVPAVHDGPIMRWDAGDTLALRHETGMRAVADDNGVILDGHTATEDWRPTRQLLFSGMSWVLARRGLLLLHGALVARSGLALIVLGGTGAGKSTVAVSGLAHGWELLADDLFAIRPPRGRVVEAFGLPKRGTIAPELARHLGWRLPVLAGDVRERRLLPMDTMSVGWRPVAGVVLVGHDHGGGRVQRLDQPDALQPVVQSFLEAGQPGNLRRHLGPLAALAGLPTHRLALAADPSGRLGRAAEHLDEAWTRSVRGQDTEALGDEDGPFEGED